MFQIADVLSNGWDGFRANARVLIPAFLIALVVTLGITMPLTIATEQAAGDPRSMATLIPASVIVQMLLSALFQMGFITISLKIVRGGQPVISDLFSNFGKLLTGFLVYLLLFVAVTLGCVMLIVPGIVLALMTCLSLWFVVDRDLGVIESIKASFTATRGSLMNLFLFGVVSLLIVAAGLIPFGLGLIIVCPMLTVATAHIYEALAKSVEVTHGTLRDTAIVNVRRPRIVHFTMRQFMSGLAVGGVLVSLAGLAIAPDRAWSSLLVAAFFLLSLGVGGAVFVALTHVTGAGWAVAFRRIPEAMARTIPFSGVAMLAVLALRMPDYGWHHHGSGDPGTFWFKELWLTPWFWMLRAAVYLVIWCGLSGRLIALSRRQDETGDNSLTTASRQTSAVFLAIYAATFSLAGIDWFMALEPMWFSTMWGVYHFSGMILAALAVVVIFGLRLRKYHGPLHGVFNDEHLHDLGKLLLGFSCFWMYIWFSQYMLIWYTNIPEETFYFIDRAKGAWGPILVLNIILNWIIPFFVLLPRPAKRNAGVMMKVAIVVLFGRAVDLYLMVFPTTIGDAPVLGIWEVAAACGVIGVAGILLARSFAAAPPVPRRDPFLPESLSYHC